MDCEPDGSNVPCVVHVRRWIGHLLRPDVPVASHAGLLQHRIWMLVGSQCVPRLQPAVRQHQLRTGWLRQDMWREHLLVELQTEQMPLRVSQQRLCVVASGQRTDVPGSLHLRQLRWILLQCSVQHRDDFVCVQLTAVRRMCVVQRKMPGLQRSVWQLFVQQRYKQGSMWAQLCVERDFLHVLVSTTDLRLAVTAQARIATPLKSHFL